MSASARALALIAALMPAAQASAEPDMLFPPATAGCYVGAEIAPHQVGLARLGHDRSGRSRVNPTSAAGALPYRKPPVGVTAVRLERGYPQLADEEMQVPLPDGGRLISLRVIVTFADAGKPGAIKRYSNGLYDRLRCTADLCDANNFKVERQADGTVLLRMTGGLYVGGGSYGITADRRLPDGHIYRLTASPMSVCR